MIKLGLSGLYVLMTAVLALPAQAQNYRPGEVIVKLKSSKGPLGAQRAYAFMGKAQTEKEMTLKESYGRMDLYNFSLGKGQSVEQAIADLQNDPDVEYAEPNYYLSKTEETGIHEVFSMGEIEAYTNENGKNMILEAEPTAADGWALMQGVSAQASAPIIAVIDTGLDTTHSVIQQTGALWTNVNEIPGNGIDDDGNGYIDDVHGWNFVHNSGTIIDDDGHGTHVTGIILSVDQNIQHTPRVQAKVRIMPLKFLDSNGMGTTSDAIRAIYYAVNNGATVLNNSWGGSSYSASLHDAVAYSYQAGTTFVAAAGNSANNNDISPLYPASLDVPNVISVAATNDSNYLASFSNYGVGSVHLGAPGTYIMSTLPGNKWGTSSGTSMATPFVSGTAGQMKVASPDMLGYQMKSILLNETQKFSQLSGRVYTGGKLDIGKSISTSGGVYVSHSQPSYSVKYLSARGLASENSMGGCGLVTKMGPGGSQGLPLRRIFISMALVMLPLAVFAARRSMNPQSRRKHERFKINSEVRISVGDRELVGSVSSISLGGAQLNTSALLQDGGLVTMSIESPDGGEKIEVGGRVVWSEANKAYGVAFEEAPQSVISKIADWTRGLQRT